MKYRLLCVIACLLAATSAPAQSLDQVMDRVAGSWARADPSAITALAARDGVSIDIDGAQVGPLSSRQAAAVLRRVFDERETVSVRSGAAHHVDGTPARAFGQLSWTTRARGTTIPASATVFLSLVHEGERWRITEIRLIP